MKNNIETVSKIYEAFEKGDIPTILTHLADNVRWEEWSDNTGQNAGVPWLLFRQGIEEVKEFFKVLGEMNFNKLEVISLMEGPDQIAAEALIEVEIPSTGATVRDEQIHLFTFNDEGKVIRFRQYLDTSKAIQAAKL